MKPTSLLSSLPLTSPPGTEGCGGGGWRGGKRMGCDFGVHADRRGEQPKGQRMRGGGGRGGSRKK